MEGLLKVAFKHNYVLGLCISYGARPCGNTNWVGDNLSTLSAGKKQWTWKGDSFHVTVRYFVLPHILGDQRPGSIFPTGCAR